MLPGACIYTAEDVAAMLNIGGTLAYSQEEDAKRECGSRKASDKPAPQKKHSGLGDL